MGNCQGGPSSIEKNQSTEDQFENKQTGKVQKAQSLRSYSSNVSQEQQNSVLQKAPIFFQKQVQQLMTMDNQFDPTQKEDKMEINQSIDVNSTTIYETFAQMNPEYKQQYEQYKTLHQQTTEQWTDPDFPPEISSLTQWVDKYPKAKQYQWLRAKDMEGFMDGQCKVFEGGITPQDIKQGALGDCYLLSSLAALAENSEQNLISRLFEHKQFQNNSMYGVWLCIMGEWQLIVVDDYFPCTSSNRPAYSKANGPELWVLLIEKAYSKVYGSYKKIEAGLTGNALRDLTGSPYIYVDNKDVEATWKLLEEYDNNENILTAGSQSDSRGTEIKQDTGIISGHAYSILGHAEVVSSKGDTCRIVQLRNPWGSHEWNGRFSDTSNDWTPELKQQLNVQNKNDGIFWMPIENYCQQYAETTINFLKRQHYYSSKKVVSNGHRCFSINFKAEFNMKSSHISITQQSDRCFEDADGNTDYSYSMVRIVIMRKTEYGYQYVKDLFKSDRDVDIRCTLKQGDYIALVEVDWCQDYSTDFVISAYTEEKIEFEDAEQLSIEEFNSYIDEAIRDKPMEEGDLKNIHEYRDGQTLFRVRSGIAGYVYFLYINDTQNLILQETGIMSNRTNLDICAPHENPEQFDVDVRPGEKIIIKYRISESGWGAFGYGVRYRSGIGSVGFSC